MPDGEWSDDEPRMDLGTGRIVCDICGSAMRFAGGCYFCTKCGQKKCTSDLT